MAAASEVCPELSLSICSSGSGSCCCGGKRMMSSRDSSPTDARNSMFENIIHGTDGGGGTRSDWLKLYEDPWEIKKVLVGSDVNESSRLLLPMKVVTEHIMKNMSGSRREKVNSVRGARIRVRDYDTAQYYNLTLKRWLSSGSYVLVNNWKRDFKKRRGLKCGDEIGLLWDPYHSLLWFRVFQPAPPPPPPSSS